jgi:hypothetical protein
MFDRANRDGRTRVQAALRDERGQVERANATAQCTTERSADPTAFAAKYGVGPKHRNAFNRCVAANAKAAATAQVHATVNASKACWTERQADPAAFKAKYGTNANKSNAFGKCVSGKVKQSS